MGNKASIYQTEQSAIKAAMEGMRYPHTAVELAYEGVTSDATPTEIFINNHANTRLELPDNSIAYASWVGLSYNLTAGVGTAYGNNSMGVGNWFARRAQTNFTLVGAATGSNFIFTADDVNDRMVCTVTGVADTTILWRCSMQLVVLTNDVSPFDTGDYEYP